MNRENAYTGRDCRSAGRRGIARADGRSVEQHSDHLPVDTDSPSAYQIALRAAARCPAPHVLVLPSPAFGFSPHHRAWPGTITLSLETFNGLVTHVVESS